MRSRRGLGRLTVVLLAVMCLASSALAQGTSDSRSAGPSVEGTETSASPRLARDTERYKFVQPIILGMLIFLMTLTLIVGVLTLVHVFRHHGGHRPRP